MWDVFELTRFWITKPNVVNERLILIACYLYIPDTPVLDCLSLPAKSTKFNFPALILSFPFIYSWFSMMIEKIEWDLEEVAFIWV